MSQSLESDEYRLRISTYSEIDSSTFTPFLI